MMTPVFYIIWKPYLTQILLPSYFWSLLKFFCSDKRDYHTPALMPCEIFSSDISLRMYTHVWCIRGQLTIAVSFPMYSPLTSLRQLHFLPMINGMEELEAGPSKHKRRESRWVNAIRFRPLSCCHFMTHQAAGYWSRTSIIPNGIAWDGIIFEIRIHLRIKLEIGISKLKHLFWKLKYSLQLIEILDRLMYLMKHCEIF